MQYLKCNFNLRFEDWDTSLMAVRYIYIYISIYTCTLLNKWHSYVFWLLYTQFYKDMLLSQIIYDI